MEELDKLQEAYDNGEPIVSDEVWDMLTEGKTLPIGTKPKDNIKLVYPMLSLDKARLHKVDTQYSFTELEAYFDRIERHTVIDKTFTVEPKYDGMALGAYYVDGKLEYLVTRGDGEYGQIVDSDLPISNIPKVLSTPVNVFVVGEVLFSKASFKRINDDLLTNNKQAYKNPRNAAVGLIKAKTHNPDYLQLLEFKPYGLHAPTDEQVSMEGLYAYLTKLGFVIDYQFIRHGLTPAGVEDALIEFMDERRDDYPYVVDGLVVKLDDLIVAKSIGTTARVPLANIAVKFPHITVRTTALYVDFRISRKGTITPVLKVEPVNIDGSLVSDVTLHNIDIFNKHNIARHDIVEIYKAGEIIPAIDSVIPITTGEERQQFTFPNECPYCGTGLTRIKDKMVCTNHHNCDEQKIELMTHIIRDIMGIKNLRRLVIANMASLVQEIRHIAIYSFILDAEGLDDATKRIIADKLADPNITKKILEVCP